METTGETLLKFLSFYSNKVKYTESTLPKKYHGLDLGPCPTEGWTIAYLEYKWNKNRKFYSDMQMEVDKLQNLAGTGQEGIRVGMALKLTKELKDRIKEIADLGERLQDTIKTIDFTQPEEIDLTCSDTELEDTLEEIDSEGSRDKERYPVRRDVSVDTISLYTEEEKELWQTNARQHEQFALVKVPAPTVSTPSKEIPGKEIHPSLPLKRKWRGGSYTHEGGSPHSKEMTQIWQEQMRKGEGKTEENSSSKYTFQPVSPQNTTVVTNTFVGEKYNYCQIGGPSILDIEQQEPSAKAFRPILPKPVPLLAYKKPAVVSPRTAELTTVHPRIMIQDPDRRQTILIALECLGADQLPTREKLDELYTQKVREIEKIKAFTRKAKREKALKTAKLWNSRQTILNVIREIFGGR